MLSLQRYIYLFEGGAGGHMAHPFDYTDFTANDLIELVDSLFKGKVEHLKEKLDGFNINASMNNDGEIIFIRNNTERNSERGGVLLKDLDERWDGKEHQKKVFMTAGKIIEQIFPKVGKEFFNPDETHRKIINCECIIAGKTNIMPYAKDRVAFHGYTIWEWNGEKWLEQEDVEGHVDELYKAAEGIDEAKPRPDLMIKNLEESIKFAEKFTKAITKLWEDEGLKLDTSIEEWKKIRFKKFAPDWCKDDEVIFNRLCNGDKSVNLRELKKKYPGQDLSDLDKGMKKTLPGKIMEPMDNLFLAIGNELLDQLDGFVNSADKENIIATVKKDTEEIVKTIENSDSVEAKDKLEKCLQRLQALGNKYNAAEGIVVMYKGRRMKFTGSFAAINQALGVRFMMENKNNNILNMKSINKFINEGFLKSKTGLEKIINVYNAQDTYKELSEKGKKAFGLLTHVVTVANLYPERINEYDDELLAFLDIVNITLKSAGYDDLKKLTSKFDNLKEVDMENFDKRFNKSIGAI